MGRDPDSKAVSQTLARAGVHQQWRRDYRTSENERFYESAFDYIAHILKAPQNATVLDAGCGACAHSLRLARRGFRVVACDFSEHILQLANANVVASGLAERITLRREDILSLTFGGNAFEYVVCWGVLMHIPDVEKAVSELSRVVKPGGFLVISEGNMYSLQARVLRRAKRLFGFGKREDLVRRPPGLEHWAETPAGRLMTREADIPWLIGAFEKHGLALRKRAPGQFTELYTHFSSPFARKLFHILNLLWFKYVMVPHPAFGNIVVFRKSV